MRGRPLILIGIALIGLLLLGGCRITEYYERERLVGPPMRLEVDPAELHWVQKATYAREGSAGGIGNSVGGGCGCY